MTCNQDCNQGRDCNCGGLHVYPVDDLREHERMRRMGQRVEIVDSCERVDEVLA